MGSKKSSTGVSITVPEKSTGRLLDALTDMIRPITEARGLKADQIRLQREDVAIEIAKRTKQKLDIEKGIINPVPTKIFVPLMEAASIEDLDDDFMIEKWANLLASAANTTGVEPRFIGILKELNGRQAAIFDAIANNNIDRFEHGRSILEDTVAYLNSNQVRRFVGEVFLSHRISPLIDDIYDDIVSHLDLPGCALGDIIVNIREDSYNLPPEDSFTEKNNASELDLEILVSLGLIKQVHFYYVSKFRHDIEIYYHHLTELGIKFFQVCQDRKNKTKE
jgi:hypothetical protein